MVGLIGRERTPFLIFLVLQEKLGNIDEVGLILRYLFFKNFAAGYLLNDPPVPKRSLQLILLQYFLAKQFVTN